MAKRLANTERFTLISAPGVIIGQTTQGVTMPDDDDIQDDTQVQEPVFDRFVEFSPLTRLRGGQEQSDLGEARSGFGQDRFCVCE
jgi:hypothetical protein